MPSPLDRNDLIQTIQGLMDRLSAPDLTAAEASALRPRLLGLLDAVDGGWPPSLPGESPRPSARVA